MNWKLTFLMLLSVLLIMLGAGGASAYIGYLMGREALKVVTQPETDSKNNLNRKKPFGGDYKGLNIIDERSVLIEVYNHKQKSVSPSARRVTNIATASQPPTGQKDAIQPEKFPFVGSSQGVTMKVTQARFQGNSVMLDVSLRNESNSVARFLYSFLDVRDADDRPISAIADGLPVEIPADGREFAGRFIIPATLLNDTQTVSLALQDYPDQKINLQLTAIPVAK